MSNYDHTKHKNAQNEEFRLHWKSKIVYHAFIYKLSLLTVVMSLKLSVKYFAPLIPFWISIVSNPSLKCHFDAYVYFNFSGWCWFYWPSSTLLADLLIYMTCLFWNPWDDCTILFKTHYPPCIGFQKTKKVHTPGYILIQIFDLNRKN